MFDRRARTALLCAGALLSAVACGDDGVLDPSDDGRVEAEIHDSPDGAGRYSGTAAGDYSVSIRTTSGTWVDLGSPNGITVALQSATSTTVHGEQSAPEGRYDRVRLTLSNVTISVAAGGEVGGTVLINDRSTVLAGDGPLVLEVAVPTFEVDESEDAPMITFDLNSETWLTGQAFNLGVVAGSTVQGKVTAVVTGG